MIVLGLPTDLSGESDLGDLSELPLAKIERTKTMLRFDTNHHRGVERTKNHER